jgi:hypothetical protein
MFLPLENVKKVESSSQTEKIQKEVKKSVGKTEPTKKVQENQPKKSKSRSDKRSAKSPVENTKQESTVKVSEINKPKLVVPKYRNLDSETLITIQKLKIDSNVQKLSMLRRINKWKYRYLDQFDY